MRKNAVIPYALIAAIGIVLVIVVSFVGVNQQEAIQEDEEGDEEQAEEQEEADEEDSEGETAADGEEVFQNNCAQCHGDDLSGGMGPALDTIGDKYSKDEIEDIIEEGFPDAGMPPGLVEGDDADAVAEWLSEKE